MLTAAGLGWYELSNWARDEAAQCRHNLLYWRGGDWWGVGPGAHSHIGGVRFWNVKHPAGRYAVPSGWPRGLGARPQAREVLDAGDPAGGADPARDPSCRRAARVACSTTHGRGWLPDLREGGTGGSRSVTAWC